LGIEDFTIDLAADTKNAVAPMFYDEQLNSLVQRWTVGYGWAYCNPPFGRIAPWTLKAMAEVENNAAHVVMLVPAAVGSNWWRDHVHNVAHVLFLNGRPTFVGASDPYPKDCAILLYGPDIPGGYSVWDWRNE
jgi:phage N-6-adenine-methyltransferase